MDDPQEQSEEHVQLSRDANRPRLERLLRDLWPWIRKKAEWMVSRKLAPLGASSLTQETAFRFSRSADAMRASEEPAVKALLSRIMENTAKDSYRAQNRVKRDNKRQLLSEMHPQDTSSAEDAYQQQEQQRQLENAIAQLPRRHQRALAMYVEERTFDEIAQELDCTVPAVRMLIQRAKSELRTLLADAHDSLGNHGG